MTLTYAPRLLNATQVAELLGIDRSTVYRMAADGRLAAIKVGRQWRFDLTRLGHQFPALERAMLDAPLGELSTRQWRESQNTLPIRRRVAAPIAEMVADALALIVFVTDTHGHPIVGPSYGDSRAIRVSEPQMRGLARRAAAVCSTGVVHEEGPDGSVVASSPIRDHRGHHGHVVAVDHGDLANTPPRIERVSDVMRQVALVLALAAT